MKTPTRGSLVAESPAEKLAAIKKVVRKETPTERKPRGIRYKCGLAALRKSLGLTQRDVCRAVGITPAGYHQIEKGHEVVLGSALKISAFFGMSIPEIWAEVKEG